jgi:hypothetical protein
MTGLLPEPHKIAASPAGAESGMMLVECCSLHSHFAAFMQAPSEG